MCSWRRWIFLLGFTCPNSPWEACPLPYVLSWLVILDIKNHRGGTFPKINGKSATIMMLSPISHSPTCPSANHTPCSKTVVFPRGQCCKQHNYRQAGRMTYFLLSLHRDINKMFVIFWSLMKHFKHLQIYICRFYCTLTHQKCQSQERLWLSKRELLACS